MSKIAKKFLISLSLVLVIVIMFSIYLNSNFIKRYFRYEAKEELSAIADELERAVDLEATIARLEGEQDVIIANLQNTDDNDLLNERMRYAFLQKGLGLGGHGDFWLWEQDWKDTVSDGRKLRVYQQDKLQYSMMMQYVSIGDSFIVIAKLIPAVTGTVSLINLMTACVFSAAALVMILLIYFLVKKITNPLIRIGETARAIANLDFKTVEVNTGDELEILAGDINHMSGKLQTAHHELEAKNRQMKTLLANVSHDLKTPVSIIKAYAGGMKDGIDDGTFVDTIIAQNEKMEKLIERLLNLAKSEQQEVTLERVEVGALLSKEVDQYRLQADTRGLNFYCDIQSEIALDAPKATLQTIFENLLSNAVKYAKGDAVYISLKMKDGGALFEISNDIDPRVEIDPDRLWEPFFVAEQSRNKDMSGTGLGLAIVRASAQKCGYECSCKVADNKITFAVLIKQ